MFESDVYSFVSVRDPVMFNLEKSENQRRVETYYKTLESGKLNGR